MKRKVYLDVLRGIAILLMVIDHAYDWWLTEAGRGTVLGVLHKQLGAMAAPLFFFLAGVGTALSSQRSALSGRPRRTVVRHLLWRGARLILWGYALNLAVFYTGSNPADLWAVDVLHAIGLCTWVLVPLLWTPAPAVVGLALLVLVLGPMAGGWALPDVAAAYLTGTGGISHFPLVLWLPYSLLGLAIGRWIGRASRPGRLMGILSAVGLLTLLGTAFVDPTWGYRHPRPVYILFSVSILFWLIAGLWGWTEKLGRSGPLVSALRDMGRTSLLLYVYHHLVGYRLFWVLGWTGGRSWRAQYGVFSPLWATVWLIALLISMRLVARLWLSRQDAEQPAGLGHRYPPF
jgi:uncharacterized membrane protein